MVRRKRLQVAQNQTWGAASIGADVEMMFGKVYRPSRLLVPYKSHMRRCSPRTRTSYTRLHTHVTIQPLVKGRAAQQTQARHRTHARKHAAETAGAAATERGWCGGRQEGGGRWPGGELMRSARHLCCGCGAGCGCWLLPSSARPHALPRPPRFSAHAGNL